MKGKLVCYILVLSILMMTGCKQADQKFISEGRIEYDVTVVDPTSSMANMVPRKMTIKFKDNKSSATMSAGMGLFSSSFISDPDARTHTVCLKLLNKKMVAVQNEQDIQQENDAFPCELEMTQETKIIAGYTCYKVHVKPKVAGASEFDVYYTKQLNLQQANFANIFHNIEGVLMEYQIKKMGFELHFIATSVTKESIDNDVFTYTSDYKKISNQEMNNIFRDLQ